MSAQATAANLPPAMDGGTSAPPVSSGGGGVEGALAQLALVTGRLRFFARMITLVMALTFLTLGTLAYLHLRLSAVWVQNGDNGHAVTKQSDYFASASQPQSGDAFQSALQTMSLSFWFACLAAVVGIVCLVSFERARREGDAIFEEVSNDLQWRLVTNRDPREKTDAAMPAAMQKPDIDSRLTIRRFVTASDLPLVPGRMGVTVYAAWFCLSFLVSLFLAR